MIDLSSTRHAPAAGLVSELIIRVVKESDAAAIADIYNHYIEHTSISFEEARIDAPEMAARIRALLSQNLPWLVAEHKGTLVAYAYAAPWKSRAAYRHSVELTIYRCPDYQEKGLGTKLYGALFQALEALPIHSAVGVIALPNPASVALHEKFGMEKVAHFCEVGRKFERWVDVGYWQKLL